jgi:hypothetical protein
MSNLHERGSAVRPALFPFLDEGVESMNETAAIETTVNLHPTCKRQIHELAMHLSKEHGRIVSESTVLEMAVDLFHASTIPLAR